MKIMIVAGARPNFMKVAAIIDAIHEHNASGKNLIDHRLVHTGQHYDERMSQSFFTDLGMPKSDVDLGVGSSSHAQQTGDIIKRFESVVLDECPDIVMVVGDVNSTIACSLVASKIRYAQVSGLPRVARPLIAHVEAGLRSFDRSMPEEVNRILTDALSDFLFITESSAGQNLRREGIGKERIFFVGNTMVDSLLKHLDKSRKSSILTRLGLQRKMNCQDKHFSPEDRMKSYTRDVALSRYGVVTLHRPSNVDDQINFQTILEALQELAQEMPMVFPAHPRTMKCIKEFQFEKYFVQSSQLLDGRSGLCCIDPLGYLDFLCLTQNAAIVLTDSGGLQEETTILGVPCVTIRKNTERPITIKQGTNVLSGVEKDQILFHARNQLCRTRKSIRPRFWDGMAGNRIIQVLYGWANGTA